MDVLCTFPGRYGDLLWALPTIRAIARRIDGPVDVTIGGEFASIAPLLQLQPYLAAVASDPNWSIDRREAPFVPLGYEAVFHLGYRGWPNPNVVEHTRDSANLASDGAVPFIESVELDLQTPWITLPEDYPEFPQVDLAFGWSEVHFELKYGLSKLLCEAIGGMRQFCQSPNSRWQSEAGMGSATWIEQAAVYRSSKVVLACCSAMHVLAVACGTPVVMMEPLEARWNDVFFPLGKTGPQVTLVMGNDGYPTFDARHVRDAVEAALNGAV